MGDKELISFLYENVSMGLEALESLSKLLEKTDNKIKEHVYNTKIKYKEFIKSCEKKVKKLKIDKPKNNLVGTMMTKMGTKMEFMRDNSDTKIAETLIQGYNMGIIDITKKINQYEKHASRGVLKLAEQYKKMMQGEIEEIKGFL